MVCYSAVLLWKICLKRRKQQQHQHQHRWGSSNFENDEKEKKTLKISLKITCIKPVSRGIKMENCFKLKETGENMFFGFLSILTACIVVCFSLDEKTLLFLCMSLTCYGCDCELLPILFIAHCLVAKRQKKTSLSQNPILKTIYTQMNFSTYTEQFTYQSIFYLSRANFLKMEISFFYHSQSQ